MKYTLILLLLPYWSFTQITDTLQLQSTLQDVEETSGLIWYNDQLWTHDDSGGATALYQINPQTGATIRTVYLEGISNIDWEDLAHDNTYIYIGDFGNNISGNRQDLKIYKILIEDIQALDTVTIDKIETIPFSYPEQIDFNQNNANTSDFDCEAMFIHNGLIHLFTKEWTREYTVHYTLPTSPTTTPLLAERINEYSVNGLITAADISPSGEAIYLLGYGDVTESASPPKNQTFGLVFQGFSGIDFLSTSPQVVDYNGGYFINGQIEGVAYKGNDEVWISAEKILFFPARLYLASLLKTSVSDIDKSSNVEIKIFPNPTNSILQVELLNVPEQVFRSEIIDTTGHILQQKRVNQHEKKISFELNNFPPKQTYFVRLINNLGQIIISQPFQIH